MTNQVTTGRSAQQAAADYLAEQHPELGGQGLSVLELEQGWLVEATPVGAGPAGPGKVVLVVNRDGFVEEVGQHAVSRQLAHRFLNVLKSAPAPVAETVVSDASTIPLGSPVKRWQLAFGR